MSSLILPLLIGLNLVAAFASQLLVVAFYGPGGVTDAFIASSAVPQFLVSVFAVVASAVVVPWLATLHELDSAAVVRRALWGVLFGSVVLAGVLMGAAPLWLGWLFPGFSGEQYLLCVVLTRIQLVAFVASMVYVLLAAYGQSRDSFRLVEGATLCSFVVSLVFLVVAVPRFGVTGAAWGTVLQSTVAAALVFMLSSLHRSRNCLDRLRFSRSLSSALGRRSAAVIAGNVLLKSETLIDRHLLASGGGGEITYFVLAQQIVLALSGLIAKAWGLPILPVMARFAVERRYCDLSKCWRRGLGTVVSITLFSAVALLVFFWLVDSFLVLGSLGPKDMGTTRLYLMCFVGMLVFSAAGSVVSGGFYALSDVRTPMFVSAVTFCCFIAVRTVAYHFWGGRGLALAVSAYFATNALLLAFLFVRRTARLRMAQEFSA